MLRASRPPDSSILLLVTWMVPEGVPHVTVAPALRVTLLDGFALRFDRRARRPLLDELPRGAQRLVARLCFSGRPPRAVIAGQLWPDVPEDHAHGSLRSALWRLQQAAPGLVEVTGSSLALADGVQVDVRELGDWVRRVRDPRCCLDDVEVPDCSVRGELLPGWYDDWVLLERERIRQLRMHALELVAVRLADVGRYGDALQAAHAAVRAEPLRESAHRTVMRVHLAEGNLIEAFRAYEEFRAMLAAELGVEPSAQMVRLLQGLHARRCPSSHRAHGGT
jgi:DNA-binding SARP family transcriptional activator